MDKQIGRDRLIAKADHGAMVVDCANYYRDLHESLSKAQHSIFIIGWDIDSRIELIRREEDRVHQTPVTLFELLSVKARENPDLQIYLNKWDYAFFMAAMREPMSVWRWRKAGLTNIHYCHDSLVPTGACHHQKIVVVDDEIAYVGGMDIAIARWDTREHNAMEELRKDPGGVYNPLARKKFPPYHDIQTVVSGAPAQLFARIARKRWVAAAGYDPIPLRPLSGDKELYQSWPDTDPPDFENIDITIEQTLPRYSGVEGVFQIEKSYLEQISQANDFIYIENQYFTVQKIAAALNHRMRERPNLRVLLVSSYDPQGFTEKVSMWSGRIRFKKVLERDVEGQVRMAYPTSIPKSGGKPRPIRIHSKIMIVDDKIIRVGSANLNNRSMRLDTECDLVYCAGTDEHKRKIADIRNDLIHEHSGIAKEIVAEMVERRVDPSAFFKPPQGSNKHLIEINDDEFFVRFPSFISDRLGDPRREVIPEFLPLPPTRSLYMQYLTKRRVANVMIFFAILVAGAIAWKNGLLAEYGSKEQLTALFDEIRTGEWAVPKAIALYAISSIAFVPVTLLTGITALIFGYWYGLLVSFSGALLAAAFGFAVGKLFSRTQLKFFESAAIKRVQKHAAKSNVIGITFLRMIPIAPFGIVNMALGLIHVPFLVFIVGTFFGLLPGKLVAMFLADSVSELWRNPDWENIGLIALGLALWVGLVWMTHYLYKMWQGRTNPAEA